MIDEIVNRTALVSGGGSGLGRTIDDAGVPAPAAPLTGISVEESSSTSPPSAATDH